jgi:HD-like signal output (HDOD) protein
MNRTADDIIGAVRHLHTFSSIIEEINAQMANESVSMRSIAATIERDPAVSAMVLRLSNSSYYGLSQKVATMAMALNVLGLKTVKDLINTASVLKIFSGAKFSIVSPRQLWLHSLGCAAAAKILLEGRGQKLQEEAFLAGLLHDIGMLVLMEYNESRMIKVCDIMARARGSRQADAEREVMGFSHMDIGYKLADHWHFPREITDAIRYHHNPKVPLMTAQTTLAKDDDNRALICASVSAGNEISKIMALGKSIDSLADSIDDDIWSRLCISLRDLPQVMYSIRGLFQELNDSLGFPSEPSGNQGDNKKRRAGAS